MTLTAEQLNQQKQQAEELLFSGPQSLGFAKGLFFGHFNAPLLFPYPQIQADRLAEVEKSVADVKHYLEHDVDSFAIDKNSEIPQSVIDGLARLGVLGMTAPKEFGGRNFSQLEYLKVMEQLGGHDSSIAVFVNAHHSIGIRALLLFGTEEQKKRWLPPLVSGEQLAAFALTEPEAGSDAANVQTTATPSADGKTFILNGQKRYITNGAIAKVLTVMARTPVPNSSETKVTAFLVTPDMPGFQVLEPRMDKCGIRGTATARLAFKDMPVPAENVLGQVGKGLRVALTVLDFGRTTFGASCTGAAKTCLKAAVKHAKERSQFKQKLADFELVRKKIAYMAACAFAMEATTAECAGFIDKGFEDYMLETAMLKVWSTEVLWTIVNDCLQIYGGQGYFTNEPYERMMRDARINQIGEGANDVLKAVLISPVGMREVGEKLKGVLDATKNPFKDFGTLWKFGKQQVVARLSVPQIPVRSPMLADDAKHLAGCVRDFGLAVQSTLADFRRSALKKHTGNGPVNEELLLIQEVLQRQYTHERISDVACELYASSCTLARLDSLLATGKYSAADIDAGRYFLKMSDRKIRQTLASLGDNDDALTSATAASALAQG
jgi:alkylation response protein AidB-like acyl-CoA dehydrogenase